MKEGATIAEIREMTNDELAREGWQNNRLHSRPTVLVLEDGAKIYASTDPEGNGPGALFGIDADGTAVRIEGYSTPNEGESDTSEK